jgi:hypothetical protein
MKRAPAWGGHAGSPQKEGFCASSQNLVQDQVTAEILFPTSGNSLLMFTGSLDYFTTVQNGMRINPLLFN